MAMKQEEASKLKMNLESHVGYRTEKGISHKLNADFAAAEAEERAIETRISRAQIQTSIQAEAVALLEGKTIEAGFNPAEREELGRVRHRIAVLRQAIKQHAPLLDRAYSQASTALCQQLKPEYARLIHGIGAALIALGLACQAERKFCSELEQAGSRFALPPMWFTALGNPLVYGSRTATWLSEAVVHGFVERSEIPQPWLDQWGCYIDAEIKKNRELAQPAPATLASRPQSSAVVTRLAPASYRQ